jgi:hypothetical protein
VAARSQKGTTADVPAALRCPCVRVRSRKTTRAGRGEWGPHARNEGGRRVA